MRYLHHAPNPLTLNSSVLFQGYQQLFLPSKTVNDTFQVGPGWLFLLGEFLGKAHWLQEAALPLNPQFQVIIRSFISDHGRLKISYGTVNADFMEDSILTDLVFSTEQRSAHICEISGRYGEFCHRDSHFRTLCFEEAQKMDFTPCSPQVAEQWSQRSRKLI
jgi:hypothetical protein